MEKERFAIVVDGINMPGYSTRKQAQEVIDKDPVLKKRGATVARLIKPQPKKTFAQWKEELRLDF